MARHLADTAAPPDAAPRLRHFVRIARAGLAHPAPRALHARRPAARAEARLKPFLRVLRGRPV